jgi:hypothetical protein
MRARSLRERTDTGGMKAAVELRQSTSNKPLRYEFRTMAPRSDCGGRHNASDCRSGDGAHSTNVPYLHIDCLSAQLLRVILFNQY